MSEQPSPIDARRGFAWGWITPRGQRFYGFDFGPFAIGVLLNAKVLRG